jgi:hypothetical protein
MLETRNVLMIRCYGLCEYLASTIIMMAPRFACVAVLRCWILLKKGADLSNFIKVREQRNFLNSTPFSITYQLC